MPTRRIWAINQIWRRRPQCYTFCNLSIYL